MIYRDANRLMKDKDGNSGQQAAGINGSTQPVLATPRGQYDDLLAVNAGSGFIIESSGMTVRHQPNLINL